MIICRGQARQSLGVQAGPHIYAHEEEVKRKEGGLGVCIHIPGLANSRGRFGGRAQITGQTRFVEIVAVLSLLCLQVSRSGSVWK